MGQSSEPIRTTHVGSLPRGERLSALLMERESGEGADPVALAAATSEAVREVVARQVELGIDIVSDGEMSKITYATYVKDRLSGFDGDVARQPALDLAEHRQFAQRMSAFAGEQRFKRPQCVGPVSYVGHDDLRADIDNLAAAAAAAGRAPRECFVNAASPGLVSAFQPNAFYASHEAYVEAVGEAMQVEYEAIVGRRASSSRSTARTWRWHAHTGFQRPHRRRVRRDPSMPSRCSTTRCATSLPSRLRMHVCWGNYEGPHDHDIELAEILPVVLRARPSAILFEASNPRHAHDWATWAAADLPDDKVLVPGVITSTSNYVEHPELVAQRIRQFVDIVGPRACDRRHRLRVRHVRRDRQDRPRDRRQEIYYAGCRCRPGLTERDRPHPSWS